MERRITKKYSNGEVTVIWQPHLCIHSTNCFRGLPQVFDPRKRPWVTIDGASSDEIVAQVEQCPSGALSYVMNKEKKEPAMSDKSHESQESVRVEMSPNGPLLVYGACRVKEKDGRETIKNKVTAFCRCGSSGNKPYCDGSHRKVGFQG